MNKKELLKSSSSVLGLNSLAKALGMGIKVIISRLLGPAGLGIYELVLAITRLGSMIPQAGLHQTVVYYISRFYSKGKETLAVTAIRTGLLIVISFSVLMAAAIWLFQESLVTAFFSDHPETWGVVVCVFLVPLFAVKNYLAFCYRGVKQVSAEVILNKLSFPLLLIIGLGIIWILGIPQNINLILQIAVGAAAVPVFIALVDQIRKFSIVPFRRAKEKILAAKMFIYAMPIWGNALLTVGLVQIDRIFIGAFSTVEELGFYGASYTFAFLISFIMGSFNPISQPLISEAYSRDDFEQIQKIYHTIVDWTGYLILPLLGGYFLFGESILGLVFGEEFEVAYWILLILAIAESINALSGPAGNILLMTNRQRISLYSLGIGFVVGLILNLLLIPPFGALGAAIGTGIAVLVINFIRVWQIRVYLNIFNRYTNLMKSLLIVITSALVIYFLTDFTEYLIILIMLYLALVAVGYWFVLDFRSKEFMSLW